MELIITAGEALDYNWWERICDLKGINVWAISEGLMDRENEIVLTAEELERLGIFNLLVKED